VTGVLAADKTLVLTSSSFAGNTLTVRGTYVAESGGSLPSLANAMFSISGPCGVAAQAVAAVQIPPLTGTYTGVAQFSLDASGNPINIPVTATFIQATTAEGNGYYYVTGTATFGSDPCVLSPVMTTSLAAPSSLEGPLLEVSYTDSVTGTVVFAYGYYGGGTIFFRPINLINSAAAYSYCNDSGSALLNQQS
jgi:hypothetical protein